MENIHENTSNPFITEQKRVVRCFTDVDTKRILHLSSKSIMYFNSDRMAEMAEYPVQKQVKLEGIPKSVFCTHTYKSAKTKQRQFCTKN